MHFISLYEHTVDSLILLTWGQDKPIHISAGLLIWLVSALVMRKGLRDPATLVPVFALEIVNEIVDRIAHGSWHWPDTVGDFIATIMWPCVMCTALGLFKGLRK
jgi:hypothetical protein